MLVFPPPARNSLSDLPECSAALITRSASCAAALPPTLISMGFPAAAEWEWSQLEMGACWPEGTAHHAIFSPPITLQIWEEWIVGAVAKSWETAEIVHLKCLTVGFRSSQWTNVTKILSTICLYLKFSMFRTLLSKTRDVLMAAPTTLKTDLIQLFP